MLKHIDTGMQEELILESAIPQNNVSFKGLFNVLKRESVFDFDRLCISLWLWL